tara:strand:- start:24 stop:866 length:843 start_codon:yes stop_codon:yes gene_type:complete
MIFLKDQIFNCKNLITLSIERKNFLKALSKLITFFYKLNIFIFKKFFSIKKIDKISTDHKQLNEVFIYFGTNKGSHFFLNNVKHIGHGYDIFYEKFFKENRAKNLNIMEFGIHHGDSLAALSCYFPNAKIIGVDRNPFSSNYQSKRIRTLHCDVSSEKNLENLSVYLDKDYDYIIDDASHNPVHQKLTFFSMFKNLKSEGIFVIEELNFFQSESDKDDPDKNFLRNLLIDISKESKNFLKSKYNNEIFDFLNDVKNVEINKGVLKHKGVNVSEIAFIKKK